jgi:hypothetical protein
MDPMAEMLADLPVGVDGHFVSAQVTRVVEAIQDAYPSIRVEWIPPSAREPGDNAFRVLDKRPDGSEYIAFFVRTEEEFDSRVLQRLMLSDQSTKSRVTTYDEAVAGERAAKELERRRHEDAMAEANDIAYHVMKSPLHNYKVNDDLTVKDRGGGAI